MFLTFQHQHNAERFAIGYSMTDNYRNKPIHIYRNDAEFKNWDCNFYVTDLPTSAPNTILIHTYVNGQKKEIYDN